MDDYYQLLNINFETSLDEINSICKKKIFHYKHLPFLTEKEKYDYKNIKKAMTIFNNPEYRKTYDTYIKKKYNNNNGKKHINQSYMYDRIFDISNKSDFNVDLNHNLRPKNVGLLSDEKIQFDTPLNQNNLMYDTISNDSYSEIN
jgi:DnaJ-class molecular chaperone